MSNDWGALTLEDVKEMLNKPMPVFNTPRKIFLTTQSMETLKKKQAEGYSEEQLRDLAYFLAI